VKASQSYDKGRGYSIGIFTNFLKVKAEEKRGKQFPYPIKKKKPMHLAFASVTTVLWQCPIHFALFSPEEQGP